MKLLWANDDAESMKLLESFLHPPADTPPDLAISLTLAADGIECQVSDHGGDIRVPSQPRRRGHVHLGAAIAGYLRTPSRCPRRLAPRPRRRLSRPRRS